jgi:hypothetical protein
MGELLALSLSRLAGTLPFVLIRVGENIATGHEQPSSFESRGGRSRNTSMPRSRERRNEPVGSSRYIVRGSFPERRDENRSVEATDSLVVANRLDRLVAASGDVRVEFDS